MKAIPTPTRKQCERVAQEVHDLTTRCVQDNSALFLIALARKFGFRGKRLNELILEFNKVEKEYEKHTDDGIFGEKITEELEAIGVDPTIVYARVDGIKMQVQKQKKHQQSQQLSIKEQIEAERLREKMFALRDYAGGKL